MEKKVVNYGKTVYFWHMLYFLSVPRFCLSSPRTTYIMANRSVNIAQSYAIVKFPRNSKVKLKLQIRGIRILWTKAVCTIYLPQFLCKSVLVWNRIETADVNEFSNKIYISLYIYIYIIFIEQKSLPL